MIPLACPLVIGLMEYKMVVPCFKVTRNGIQFIFAICQVPKLLVSVCTRANGEFSVKIFNRSKSSRMISLKLPLVGVRIQPHCVVTWDKKILEEQHIISMISLQDWEQKYSSIFEEGAKFGQKAYMERMKVCHK